MSYTIPDNLASEIKVLSGYIDQYQAGELDGAVLKSHRVPFGCYEQRKDGTYMARIRTTGGDLTPAQLRRMAELSSQYGAPAIHVTTRQEFQIHDIDLANITTVMEELLAVDLATRGGGGNTVRNIMVSPDAGISTDEVFDPAPCAYALTTRLIAEPDSWKLPRKFKISFANSSTDNALAQFNDLGFIARTVDGVNGFRVYVAGGMGARPEVGHLLEDFIPAEDIYLVTTAIKRIYDQHGNRKNRHAARLRFLWNTLGEARFRELYQQQLTVLRGADLDPLVPAAPLRRSTVPGFAPVSDDSPEFAQWKLRYAQPQRQPGLYSVLVPVLLGNLSNEAAIQLADFAGAFGDDSIRANFGQNLQLRNIPEHYLANAFQILRQVADLASAPRLLANSVSCTGADTCKLGICLPKGALTATVDALRSSDLDLDQIPDFRLHLSGCPNTCGQHIVADLGFYGNVGTKEGQMFPAYAVVAGAAIGNGEARLARAIDRIAAHDLPSFVRDVLALWLQKKSEYASFAAYIDSDGTQDIRAVADRYRRIPTFAENAEYYKDWGASDKFSLVGKSAGECSAGIFDLIEIDLKKAKQLRETLTSTEDNGAALYKIALLAARALLVTRDIEVQTEAAVFDSFHKHFVVAGLVDSRFEPAIAAARRQDGLALAGQERDVLALLDAVNLLYQNMNDSLRSS